MNAAALCQVEHQVAPAPSNRRSRRLARRCGVSASPCLPGIKEEAWPIYANAGEYTRKMAALGAALLRHGVNVKWSEKQTLGTVVTRALSDWLKSQWGELRRFDLSCFIQQGLHEFHGDDMDEWLEAAGPDAVRRDVKKDFFVDLEDDHVALVFDCRNGRWDVVVGWGVEALEAKVPGLGWEALRWIENVGAQVDLFGIEWLECCVQRNDWGWMEDEVQFCEEYGEDVAEFTGYTRADLDSFAPVKAMRASVPPSAKALSAARQHPDPLVRRVAALVRQLRATGEVATIFPDEKMREAFAWDPPIDGVVALGWHHMRDTEDVYDTNWNNVAQGECNVRPYVGCVCLSLTEPDSLANLEKRWSKGLSQLRLVDALLVELESITAPKESDGGAGASTGSPNP